MREDQSHNMEGQSSCDDAERSSNSVYREIENFGEIEETKKVKETPFVYSANIYGVGIENMGAVNVISKNRCNRCV